MLQKCRQAARRWSDLIQASDDLILLMEPELDIIVMFPRVSGEQRVSAISDLTHQIFEAGMHEGPDAFFLAKVNLTADRLTAHSNLVWDQPTLVGLRSVLMKPEHLAEVPRLHERIVKAMASITVVR